MCGLVGVAGNITLQHEKMFKRMLELDTIRGPHSTGIVSVNRGREVNSFKKVGTPWDMYQYKGYDTIMRGQHSVLMGHNRWATKGAVNAVNAHPFQHGKIIGMHNGTLVNQRLLDDDLEFDVDSENIIHHINKHSIDDTVSKLHGAYALAWYNTEEHSLNFIRNSERTLYGCVIGDNKDAMAWASEPFMLWQGAAHASLKIIDQPVIFAEHELMTLDILDPKDKAGILSKGKARKLTPYKPPVHVVTSHSKQQPQLWLGAGVGAGVQAPQKQTTTVSGPTTSVFTPIDKDYLNKTVEIEVVGACQSEAGLPYVQALIYEEDADMEVRLYATAASKLWNILCTSDNVWDVYIKYINTARDGNVYGVGDLRSLVEVILPSDDEEDDDWYYDIPDNIVQMYPGYNGAVLDMESWEEHTDAGCSWCGDPVTVLDAFEIAWYGTRDLLCAHCKTNSDAAEAAGLNLIGEKS